jgi:sensor c-di-GMP phosphodiesterase-like protein
MRNQKHSAYTVLLSLVVFALCGAAVGLLTGRMVILTLAGRRLAEAASRSAQVTDSYSTDARSALSALNSSSLPPCSEAERAFIRQLLFHSIYLKDGGHIRDGRLECSAMQDHSSLPESTFTPSLIQRDGTAIYQNVPLFHADTMQTILLAQGGSYVILDLRLRAHNLPSYVQLDTTSVGAVRPPASSDLLHLPGYFTREGIFRNDHLIAATHCSAQHPICTTASLDLAELWSLGRLPLVIFLIGGALCGALAGLQAGFQLTRRRSWSRQLQRAIRKETLQLAYQPIVDLDHKNLAGAEALLRWKNEDGEQVSPEVFIPMAEKRGLMPALTRLVLRRALHDFGPTLQQHPDFNLSVNISALDLADPGFPDHLQKALAEAGVAARQIVLELTESSAAQSPLAINAIRRLRQAGHRIHIDDFGTGYSSLSYLSDLHVDAIKIDRSFTRAIGSDSINVTLLPQILTMAESIHLQIVVEGIETEEQLAFFTATHRSLLAQGWLFGRPMPPESLRQLLENESSSPRKAEPILTL